MGRRRNSDRRNLPPNLYIRNNGYYCYRDPRTGKEFGLGRDKRLAVNEAIQANIEIFACSEHKTLVSRINSDDIVTMHAWLDRYEIIIASRGLKQKTITDYGSKLRAIREKISDIPITDVTTKQIASLLNDYVSEGKSATAKLIRSTLSDIFREAIAEGHISVNPVAATRAAKAEVKRARLTIEEYRSIYEAAREFPEWVCLAMDFAVVTGQRVGDLCEMKWSDIVDGYLYVEQRKTSAKLAIPTKLKSDELGLSMEDILQKCKNLGGETIISSTRRKPLSSGTISRYFMRARKASGLSFSGEPPTFHELRSLSARIYEKQISDKFAQHLLGHKSDSMALQYRDDRGREWDKIEFN
ncbi:tyrosine-type recombinase/integrase [Enterobacter asburiae]|uniref:tyrosine-type recombinase/integrase n=1 Tax=Enterobacter asburiae TaxID=61645 RepID=UPI00192BAC52|nr:tyrosine-type recombinase/integrase [Enterobacter asburiae]MBL5927799.1 tyrosine-type recombinase/integrase [Enterobacter asburiae]MBL5958586.1 tyrosine-type recombinase/integrase [Enterobacter asburiae]